MSETNWEKLLAGPLLKGRPDRFTDTVTVYEFLAHLREKVVPLLALGERYREASRAFGDDSDIDPLYDAAKAKLLAKGAK